MNMDIQYSSSDDDDTLITKLAAKDHYEVQIVYYLNRGGQIDYPHMIEGCIPADGLHLRDFKKWLGSVRGNSMPNSFSWSYKRNYKGGFIWHDLSDNDLICPVQRNEYVLMGSETPHDNFPHQQGSSYGQPQSQGKDELRMHELGKDLSIKPHELVYKTTITSKSPPLNIKISSPRDIPAVVSRNILNSDSDVEYSQMIQNNMNYGVTTRSLHSAYTPGREFGSRTKHIVPTYLLSSSSPSSESSDCEKTIKGPSKCETMSTSLGSNIQHNPYQSPIKDAKLYRQMVAIDASTQTGESKRSSIDNSCIRADEQTIARQVPATLFYPHVVEVEGGGAKRLSSASLKSVDLPLSSSYVDHSRASILNVTAKFNKSSCQNSSTRATTTTESALAYFTPTSSSLFNTSTSSSVGLPEYLATSPSSTRSFKSLNSTNLSHSKSMTKYSINPSLHSSSMNSSSLDIIHQGLVHNPKCEDHSLNTPHPSHHHSKRKFFVKYSGLIQHFLPSGLCGGDDIVESSISSGIDEYSSSTIHTMNDIKPPSPIPKIANNNTLTSSKIISNTTTSLLDDHIIVDKDIGSSHRPDDQHRQKTVCPQPTLKSSWLSCSSC